jgi:hypothetical protein
MKLAGCTTLALVALLAAAGVRAEDDVLAPIDPDEPVKLGAAWDSDARSVVGDEGCIRFEEPDRREGGVPTWTLLTLSRVGERLLLGLYASAPVATEGMLEAKVEDASRRLAGSDREGFRDLCGDGFVAARAWGAQYVAEIEIDPDDVTRASAVLEAGVWTDPEEFRSAVEAVIGRFGATARELPGGRRARAKEIAPAEALRKALELPEHVTAETARPYLAMIRPYPDSSLVGLAIEIDPTLGWGDAARYVFLHDQFSQGATSAAVRAAEMRKAVVKRDPASAPVRASAPAPAGMAPAEAPARPAPVAAAPAEGPVRLERVAALVFSDPSGVPVYATTHAPPGVYAEQVKQRAYWLPGVAQPTDDEREALGRAAKAAPTRGTTVVFAEVGATPVVLTDVAPAGGVYATRAGSRHAWIAGVREPDAAQRKALAAVAGAAPD